MSELFENEVMGAGRGVVAEGRVRDQLNRRRSVNPEADGEAGSRSQSGDAR